MEETVSARQQAGLEAATALVGSDLNRQLDDAIEDLTSRIKSTRFTIY